MPSTALRREAENPGAVLPQRRGGGEGGRKAEAVSAMRAEWFVCAVAATLGVALAQDCDPTASPPNMCPGNVACPECGTNHCKCPEQPEPEPEPDSDCHDCDTDPVHGSRGTCTDQDYGPGHVCNPTCDTGYEPVDQQGARGDAFVRTCTDGHCTDSGTTCEPVHCGVAPEKDHTSYPDGCTDKVYPQTCNARCDAEFSVNGQPDGLTVQTVDCESSGMWSSLEPCQPIGCQIAADALDNWPGSLLGGGAESQHGPFGCGINTCGQAGDEPCFIGDGKSCEVVCREGYGDEDSGQKMGLSCSSDGHGGDKMNTTHLPKCTLCDETHYKAGNNTDRCSACPVGFRTGRQGATDESECSPYVTLKSISSSNSDPHVAAAGDVVTVVLEASSLRITDVNAVATVTTWKNGFSDTFESWFFPTGRTTQAYDTVHGIRTFIVNYTVPAVGPLNTTQNTVPAQDKPDGRFWLFRASMSGATSSDAWNLDFGPSNGTAAEDGSFVKVHTDKAECPDSAANNYNRDFVPGRLALGGWCQAWGGNKCHWDTSTASIVLAGGFKPDCRAMPDKSPWIMAAPQRFYLVLGGFGVGGDFNPPQTFAHCATEATQQIVDYLLETRAEGIAFDLEGWLDPLHLDIPKLKSFVEDLRDQLPELKVALTPGDQPWSWHYDHFADWVDFITPMMYAGANTYQGRDYVSSLQGTIPLWTGHEDGQAGWPASKVFLTYQSDSAAGGLNNVGKPLNEAHHDVLHYLARQVKEKHFAGMLGWPAAPVGIHDTNCPQGFQASLKSSGCCEATCDNSTGTSCYAQLQTHKEACEQRGWIWKTFDNDKDYRLHPYTCCRCGEPPCSSDPARATTLAMQAVVAAQLGVDTAQASATDSHKCHYSCSGLINHFGLSAEKAHCFIGSESMPPSSSDPLQYFDEVAVFQGCGRAPLQVRVEAHHSDLVLRHIQMSHLHSSSTGGALALTGGRLVVEYSDFFGNRAVSGGAISTTDATEVCIRWCTFANNHVGESISVGETGGLLLDDALEGSGGALMLGDTIGRVTLSDSTFNSNTAVSRGGAVLIDVTETLGRFLEPIVIENCGGSGNRAGTGSALQVAGYTVPEDALSIGQNSQWAQASITAASQGCPLSLSEEEMHSYSDHACPENLLGLGESCHVSCTDSETSACSYGKKQQWVNCTRASGGAAVLIRSGVCSGKQCTHARAAATCGTHLAKATNSLGGECCEIGSTSVCHCPLDWGGPSSDSCGIDECKRWEGTPLGKCPGGICQHSTKFVSGMFAKGYYVCHFDALSRTAAVIVTFLASVVPLFHIVRSFRAAVETCREQPQLSGAEDALGFWGLFCFVLGIFGLAINVGQTITLWLQDEYTLFACSVAVQVIVFSTTLYFQTLILREIEDPVHGSQAKTWQENHKKLCTTVRLLSSSRLQGLAILRLHVNCCGEAWNLIDMPISPKVWRFLRDAGMYIHLIADVPNFVIAVALLHIQVVTRETVGMCEDEHSFLPDMLCGWIPDAFHAPKEVSLSVFAYLQISRSLVSMVYGIIGRLRHCCAKTTAARQSSGLKSSNFTSQSLSKPLLPMGGVSEDPAPAAKKELGVRWPTDLTLMPLQEQHQLKTEVAKAQQLYPDGSALLSDERRRLETAYHVDEDVMQGVFEFVALNGSNGLQEWLLEEEEAAESQPQPQPEPEPEPEPPRINSLQSAELSPPPKKHGPADADDDEPLFAASATRPASPQRPPPRIEREQPAPSSSKTSSSSAQRQRQGQRHGQMV